MLAAPGLSQSEDEPYFSLSSARTFGAAESIDDPLAENAQVQWGEKASYAWTAVKDSALLREEAFGLVQGFLPRADVPTLAVFNTLGRFGSGATSDRIGRTNTMVIAFVLQAVNMLLFLHYRTPLTVA